MGHYCRICHRIRPNEAFSGRGHPRHVCRRCKRLAAEVDADEEVLGFLRQSHISAKNIARLRVIAASANPKRAEWAAVILEVALVAPYKRRRLPFLAKQHRDLLEKLERCCLVAPWIDFAEPAGVGGESPPPGESPWIGEPADLDDEIPPPDEPPRTGIELADFDDEIFLRDESPGGPSSEPF